MRFQNTGTTAVSCTLGIGSATATANENIIQPSSFVDVLIGANTFGACIDQTGSASNLVVLSGGTTGDPAVVAALNGATPAGTNIIGGTVPSAGTTGGCTGQTPLFTAASNNATQYKNSQGTVCGWDFDNTTTSLFSIRFYDTASAPAAGAPCNSSANLIGAWVQQSNAVSGGQRNSYPVSLQFNAGLVVCITGANANNDNTNAVTGGNFNLRIK
jgi:hypothetical protein